MDCEEIKKIIPRYFQHAATDEEVKLVEEHLCVCHNCRIALGELMDEASGETESVSEEVSPEKAQTPSQQEPVLPQEETKEEPFQEQESQPEEKKEPEPLAEEKKMEYFPGEGLTSQESVQEPVPESAGPEQADEESIPVFEEEKPTELPEKEVLQEVSAEQASDEISPGESIESMLAGSSHTEAQEAPAQEPEYPLDQQQPIGTSTIGVFEYIVLFVGIIIFLYIIYLLIKG